VALAAPAAHDRSHHGPLAEGSFHKAIALWGWEFVLRPVSLVMMALAAVSLAWSLRRNARQGRPV
jgi:hypothetical protein